jgi:hypothetical protein
MTDLHLGDRFAMLVGKMVIGGVMIWGATVVLGPFLRNIDVKVTWDSKEKSNGGQGGEAPAAD